MHAVATQTRFLLQQYDKLLAGLDDRHRALEPVPGTKTAGWLLGHLCITGDFARRLAGRPPIAPKEWRPLFAPGTTPSTDPNSYPPMHELTRAFRAIYQDLAEHAPTSTADTLDAPNPFEAARPAFPTGRDFLRYLMTGHLGYHLGQLSIWRATAANADPDLR